MDVISFLCVSLGNSTVQLHDSLGNRRACACSHAGFVVKMVTMLEGCTTEEQSSVVLFLCGQKTRCKRYGGKCSSHKAVHNWVVNVSLMRKGWNGGAEVGWDNSPRDFYVAGFDALVKVWDKCINAGWTVCQKLLFVSMFWYHMFYVSHPFVIIYWLYLVWCFKGEIDLVLI
jgi:hypothetical protein